MSFLTVSSVVDLDILHCCAERGVHYNIFLDEKLDVERIDQSRVTNLNLYKNESFGFFRFYLAGFITISGTTHGKNISVLFSFFRLQEAIAVLEEFIPGFRQAYIDLKNFPK